MQVIVLVYYESTRVLFGRVLRPNVRTLISYPALFGFASISFFFRAGVPDRSNTPLRSFMLQRRGHRCEGFGEVMALKSARGGPSYAGDIPRGSFLQGTGLGPKTK